MPVVIRHFMFCLKKYIGLDVKKCYLIILRNLLTIGVIGFMASRLIYFLIGVSCQDKKSLLCVVSNRLRRIDKK